MIRWSRFIVGQAVGLFIASPVVLLYAIHVTIDFITVDRAWADWLLTKAETIEEWSRK